MSAQIPAHTLHEGLDRYIASRREKVPEVLRQHFTLTNCIKIQAKHFLKDLIRNPINTLWAIPYLSIRKGFEVAEKLGFEAASSWLPKIPKSLKTDFQKEMEKIIRTELFGLGTNSELEKALANGDPQKLAILQSHEWRIALADAEKDIRSVIASFCDTQNGFTDLAASTGIVVAARRYFGDGSLDVFGIGKHWASRWARDRAESRFFLGKKIGHEFYRIVPPPAASSHQIYKATAYSLALLAVFSTLVNILSYPVKNMLGFQKKQFESLIRSVEDKLLLRLTKTLKAQEERQGSERDFSPQPTC